MLENKTYIETFCTIQNNEIILNGETIFKSDSDLFADFSKKANLLKLSILKNFG